MVPTTWCLSVDALLQRSSPPFMRDYDAFSVIPELLTLLARKFVILGPRQVLFQAQLLLSEGDNIGWWWDRLKRDPCLDLLLDLDGQILIVDEKGEYWVKFNVREVPVTEERPHGLHYSLTLHGKNNERLVGFDNAHSIRQSAGPSGKAPVKFDHKHSSARFGHMTIARLARC